MKKAGRPPKPYSPSPYRKKGLSSDARVIIALKKKQPQNRKELCNNAKISKATFYRVRSLLISSDVIKEVDVGYALRDFNTMETVVEDAFDLLIKKGGVIHTEDIENEVGMSWREIETITRAIAKKRGWQI